jgi:hypothetical protein
MIWSVRVNQEPTRLSDVEFFDMVASPWDYIESLIVYLTRNQNEVYQEMRRIYVKLQNSTVGTLSSRYGFNVVQSLRDSQLHFAC